jgi:hypothetical protein
MSVKPPSMEPVLPRILSELGASVWVFFGAVGSAIWAMAHLFFRVRRLEDDRLETRTMFMEIRNSQTLILDRLARIETREQAMHRHQAEQA